MKKHKFEDNGYFEESREINDGVRNAVAAGKLSSILCWREVIRFGLIDFRVVEEEKEEGRGW